MKVLIVDDENQTLRRILAAEMSCPKMKDKAEHPMSADGACSELNADGTCRMLTAGSACPEKGADGKRKMQAAAAGTLFSGRILAAGSDKASPEYGWRWRVQIIAAGEDKQGNVVYPLAVLHEAAPLYEGAKVFALTEGQHSAGRHPYGNSVRDLVGRIQGVKPNPIGNEGTLVILKSAANQWLRDALVDAFEQGMIGEESTNDVLGLSHDVRGAVSNQGKKLVAQKIVKVNSVDVVYEPIGGGKFLRMAAAAQAASQKEATMYKQLLAALKTQRPDLKMKIEELEAKGDAVTAEEVNALVASAVTKADEGTGMDAAVAKHVEQIMAAAANVSKQEAQKLLDKAMKTFDDATKITACASQLATELVASGLPDKGRARVQKQFAGTVFELKDLQAAIKDEKEYVDSITGSGAPEGGGMTAEVVAGEPERLQAALDKLFGCDVDAKFKDVPAMTSLRGAYTRITGDPELRGIPNARGMKLGAAFMKMMDLHAAYSSSAFSFALGNSMYRRLLKEYAAVNYREDVLISFYRNAENFKTMEIVQVGYLADVPDVNPETGDYVEVTMPTDIEATYNVNQKGWILSVTRRVLMNDDLKTVVQLVSKMGRAHRRTHARRAWNKLISNANYKGDNVALFHGNHGNLGSTALTLDATGIATLTAALKRVYAQTEQDSGEGLALEAKYMWGSRDIQETMKGLNSKWDGALAVPNPHAGKFGANHENIIVNPLFTDVNDWGLIADSNEVEILEAAYINGKREPEFFVADNPLVGQMFVADKLQYKSRHEYEFEIADYRGVDKSVVA